MKLKKEILCLCRIIPKEGDNYRVIFNKQIYKLHVSISHVSIVEHPNNALLLAVYGDDYEDRLDELYGYSR